MFKHAVPNFFSHISATDNGNYTTPTHIIHKDDNGISLFHKWCPHRLYPLAKTGEHLQNITCKLHGFEWDSNGVALNNSKKLICGKLTPSKSGLLFKNFNEPDNHWVGDLSKERNLKYSHCLTGSSNGSFLWLMDIEADLLHVYKNGIHPFLSKQINLEDIVLEQGDGWILQNHPDGWWLYVFPYTFIEYRNPGCLMINYTTSDNNESEFGYSWVTQFYYDDAVNCETRMIFETLKDVFLEDVAASEKQKGAYFPLVNAMDWTENHCVHFGEWYRANKK